MIVCFLRCNSFFSSRACPPSLPSSSPSGLAPTCLKALDILSLPRDSSTPFLSASTHHVRLSLHTSLLQGFLGYTPRLGRVTEQRMRFPVIALASTLCPLWESTSSTHPAFLVSCSIPAPSVGYIAEDSGNTYRTSGSQVVPCPLYLSLHSISQLQWVPLELMTVV